MQYAAITGWGKCMPPAVLSNADLATIMDTDDEWITTRTGIRERRVSHVSGIELAHVASARALACAGLAATDVDLIVYGSCSNDEQIPNSASGLQFLLGAIHAAAMDVNTACTSFLYSLSTATAMIRTGAIRNALVVGVELISPFMDWTNRNVAVLFGDGAAAVVLQATDRPEGVLGEKLGCYADARQTLRVRGIGLAYANGVVTYGDTMWDFDGQEIFKRAVVGMSHASDDVLARCGHRSTTSTSSCRTRRTCGSSSSSRASVGAPMDRVFLTIQRYGNMSAATVPVALVDALEEGRVAAGRADPDAGVRRRPHLVRAPHPLGRADDAARHDRHRPAAADADRARDGPGVHGEQGRAGRSTAGLNAVRFPESA